MPVVTVTSGSARRDATDAVPERSPKTRETYRREAARLLAKADPDGVLSEPHRLLAAARGFAQAHDTWARATISVYRASLRQVAEDLAAAGHLDADVAAEVEALVAAGPTPRSSKKPRQTSGRKRRSLPQAERDALVAHLATGRTRTTRLLAALVALMSIIPIRPSEWRRARVVSGHLFIVCAKRSNKRAIARVRRVQLLDEATEIVAARTVKELRGQIAAAGSWEKLYARLTKALTRECEKIGIAPISLYTLRHQAIATAKRHLAIEVVAALSGHASSTTATHYYAKRRSGWQETPKVEVTDRLVSRVRGSKKAPQLVLAGPSTMRP